MHLLNTHYVAGTGSKGKEMIFFPYSQGVSSIVEETDM